MIKAGANMSILLIVFIAICYFVLASQSCPLNKGDKVYRQPDGKPGVITHISNTGGWTAGCKVAVVYDDGTSSLSDDGPYVYNWEYKKAHSED